MDYGCFLLCWFHLSLCLVDLEKGSLWSSMLIEKSREGSCQDDRRHKQVKDGLADRRSEQKRWARRITLERRASHSHRQEDKKYEEHEKGILGHYEENWRLRRVFALMGDVEPDTYMCEVVVKRQWTRQTSSCSLTLLLFRREPDTEQQHKLTFYQRL